MTTSEFKRENHRLNCKHWYAETCRKKSGWSGNFHILVSCDGDCKRMKNYDKKKKVGNNE